MKNNTRGLFIHLLVNITIFGMAMLINMNQTLTKVMYGNLVFKIILGIIPIFLYYNLAKGLSKKVSSKLDFFAGNIIILIFILLAAISLIGINSIYSSEVAGTLWRLPMDIFMFTEVYILNMLNREVSIFNLFITSFIPTIIYGISIKRSRAKINRHNRTIEIKRRKR